METQLKEAKAIGSQVGVGKRMCEWVKKREPGSESQDAFTSPTMEVSTFDSTLVNQSSILPDWFKDQHVIHAQPIRILPGTFYLLCLA